MGIGGRSGLCLALSGLGLSLGLREGLGGGLRGGGKSVLGRRMYYRQPKNVKPPRTQEQIERTMRKRMGFQLAHNNCLKNNPCLKGREVLSGPHSHKPAPRV